MWLLPVVLRRQTVLAAPRTPLRDLVLERGTGKAATGAVWRIAARRSRAKAKFEDKSKNILSAPSL